jgi:hypothetical protein
MSRVTYTNVVDTPEQAGLREAHRVRLVSEQEEGTGLNKLPPSIYGFTYSPGIDEAPVFAKRSFRSYEAHKLANGEVTLVGFTAAESARQLTTSTEDISLQVQPMPEDGQETLVEIPYSRVRRHKGYAAPNQHGFSVIVAPLLGQS